MEWECTVMSQIDLPSLFSLQAKLDRKIMESHHLGETEDIVRAKVLALYVELGELANETRCFKYWSVKPPSARQEILEEYVDALHFVLSLGLSLNYQNGINIENSLLEPDHGLHREEQVKVFTNLFHQVALFAQESSLANYQRLFQGLIQLGQALGFSWQEIEQAYLEKNKVNHQRQEEGY